MIFVLFTIFILLSIIYSKYRMVNFALSFIYIFIFSIILGFRTFDSGVDTQSYVNYFHSISNLETPEFHFEIGFRYFTILFSLLVEDYFYVYLLTFLQLFFLFVTGLLLRIKNILDKKFTYA